MQRISCDVAVIGAGTAGLAAYEAAAKAGARAVLIEAGPPGTTCARVGCMPSKLLIAAADAAHAVAGAGRFGVFPGGRGRHPVADDRPDAASLDPGDIDGRAVMARVRRERDRFVRSALESFDAVPAADRLAGRARFLDATTLAVEGGPDGAAGGAVRVSARAVVIAVGARPAVPEALSGVLDRVLTHDTVFELADLPPSLAVLGAGPVGIELGQAMRRLGVRVAVLDHGDHVATLRDPEVAAAARDALAREIDLRLGVSVEAAPEPGGARLRWTPRASGPEGSRPGGAGVGGARPGSGPAGEAVFARVLAAAGRPPALDGLDLDRTGLALDENGVPRFDPATLQCGDAPVFLAGDADGDRPVLHEARIEGAIAGANAARHPEVRPGRRPAPLSIVFTDPQIATVGRRFDALDPDDLAVGRADYRDQGRARVQGRNVGLVRVYARAADGVLLGAEMAGPGVEHAAHLLAWAVQAGWTAQAVLAMPFYHPTLEEGLRSAVRDLRSGLRDGRSGAGASAEGAGAAEAGIVVGAGAAGP